MRPAASSRPALLLWIAAGGALGTVVRHAVVSSMTVGVGLSRGSSIGFPWPTATVNLVGAMLAGAALGVLARRGTVAPVVRGFALAGFCGGLTTFSTWMLDSVLLARDGQVGIAVLAILVQLVGGLALFVLARRLTGGGATAPFDRGVDE